MESKPTYIIEMEQREQEREQAIAAANQFAQQVVTAATARGSSIKFLGDIHPSGMRDELIPNPTSPALMDVARITSYDGLFMVREKFEKRGRKIRYHLHDAAKVTEVGTYKDAR